MTALSKIAESPDRIEHDNANTKALAIPKEQKYDRHSHSHSHSSSLSASQSKKQQHCSETGTRCSFENSMEDYTKESVVCQSAIANAPSSSQHTKKAKSLYKIGEDDKTASFHLQYAHQKIFTKSAKTFHVRFLKKKKKKKKGEIISKTMCVYIGMH
ncbi:hypothetical protein RFI_19827, partial [Reticulomyxa filosa]